MSQNNNANQNGNSNTAKVVYKKGFCGPNSANPRPSTTRKVSTFIGEILSESKLKKGSTKQTCQAKVTIIDGKKVAPVTKYFERKNGSAWKDQNGNLFLTLVEAVAIVAALDNPATPEEVEVRKTEEVVIEAEQK